MTADELATLIRCGAGESPVSKIVLSAEGQTTRGSGVLKVESDRLALWLEPGTKNIMPKRGRNIWTEKNFWSISGLIDGELAFSCNRVSPGQRRDRWRSGKTLRTTQELHLSGIEVKPAGWDKLSNAQKRKALNLLKPKGRKSPKVEFEAVLVGCEQVFRNAGTYIKTKNDFLGTRETSSADTFIDRGRDYDFALIKEGDDLHVHLRSKAEFRSKSEEDDWRRFNALLTAVGFTHGVHPGLFVLRIGAATEK
jgi:hypothetical protein